MLMIVTVCGRKFRCLPGSAVLQELSDEVRQHLCSAPPGSGFAAVLKSHAAERWRGAAACCAGAYAASKLALVRALMSARPVVQWTLGL